MTSYSWLCEDDTAHKILCAFSGMKGFTGDWMLELLDAMQEEMRTEIIDAYVRLNKDLNHFFLNADNSTEMLVVQEFVELIDGWGYAVDYHAQYQSHPMWKIWKVKTDDQD